MGPPGWLQRGSDWRWLPGLATKSGGDGVLLQLMVKTVLWGGFYSQWKVVATVSELGQAWTLERVRHCAGASWRRGGVAGVVTYHWSERAC